MTAPITSALGREPDGRFVELDGESYYRIGNVDRMPPFLMSIASDTDLWMFVTSTGGLTAGRVDPEGSLFPYDNVDRLYDAHHVTGPVTLIRAGEGGDATLWEPFADRGAEAFRIERNLYKNVAGNRLVFEEINHDLALTFRYRWSGCEAFGFVRSARLTRLTGAAGSIAILDGLRNVLPFGASLALYQRQSSLVDAYKRNECDPSTGLAVFSLTSRIIDRAEAAEELRANIVWSRGLERAVVSVSDEALNAFRAGEPVAPSTLSTGRRGHYLMHATVRLSAGESANWQVIADAGRGPVELVALRERLRAGGIREAELEAALQAATDSLVRTVASADGLQVSANQEGTAHHFANVMFNNMRGGVFVNDYIAPTSDIIDHLHTHRRAVAERHAGLLAELPEETDVLELVAASRRTGDADFERLCLEYLPLSFGRRHGDPSRPWNRFTIRVRNADGSPALYYEGNWRDVFQNWEALAMSFPAFLPGMIAKFVNASTVDGFNPYRITRDGIDWEVVEPDDPWGYIGYWGDHQIVYLLRLLEALHAFAPETLREMLDRRLFSYANVPYRLESYESMLADPHATVRFDAALHAEIVARVSSMGTDGRLVLGTDGSTRHACLVEKLLVSALARLSNFVPDGGIWMNTQRPEWNDANNALAGYGVSTVTLAHLRRYLRFLADRLTERGDAPVLLAADVAQWAAEVREALQRHLPTPGTGPRGERMRKTILDALGAAFGRYRDRAYAQGLTASVPVPAADLLALCHAALAHVDHSLALNRRADGLYHAYHVLGPVGTDALPLQALHLMLEGQVAALSSGAMAPSEAASLTEALFESALYDPERRSFMLYPERELPAFLDKNSVPAQSARAIGLLADQLAAGDASIVAMDAAGRCRFHPDLSQAARLAAKLDELARRAEWSERAIRDREAVLALYESVFHHHSFTGRSGTMYGYEGIGCIYWHMVAKLLLAVQEQARSALRQRDPAAVALVRAYDRIRRGLGSEKSPQEFGAFPTDPYSHTPKHEGARQPGMTGQVKEEILTRLGELGVCVEQGTLRFEPALLRRAEFLTAPREMLVHDALGRPGRLVVPAQALAFTFCQVPVIYHVATGEPWVRITRTDGAWSEQSAASLDPATSRALFERRSGIARIDLGVPAGGLLGT